MVLCRVAGRDERMARSLLQQSKQEGQGQKGAMFGGIESGQAEGGEKKALT